MAPKLNSRYSPSSIPALGASGAIMALTSMYALTFPTNIVSVFFIPMPAWLAIGGFFAYDLYQTLIVAPVGQSTSGHVGGAIYGALYWYFKMKR